MCWQNISLKDPSSQELLEAVERERSLRLNLSRRTATIFHHPTLGDFELQHQLHLGVDDPELEERIIQHLAAAAAMRRTHRIARREGSRSRSSAHTHPQFVVLSSHPIGSSSGPVSASITAVGTETESAETNPSVPPASVRIEGLPYTTSPQSDRVLTSAPEVSNDNRSNVNHYLLPNQDRAGPSEIQSDSWKSRLNAMSTKYKESISKSTRGWKEKLFSRSSSMADIGNEVRREVNAGIATVTRLMERLETRDGNGPSHVPLTNNTVDSSGIGPRNPNNRDMLNETSSTGISSSCATSSV